jgi:hypothetical protein
MTTVSSLIKDLGGPTVVARALGCAVNVIGNWPARGNVPWHHHDALLKFAASLGKPLTREDLRKLAPVPGKKRSTRKRAA